MKIINKELQRIQKCSNCNCEFNYTDGDCKYSTPTFSELQIKNKSISRLYLTCPNCNNKILL